MQINTSSKIRIFFGKIRTCKKNTHTYKIRKFLVKIRPYIKKYASQIKEKIRTIVKALEFQISVLKYIQNTHRYAYICTQNMYNLPPCVHVQFVEKIMITDRQIMKTCLHSNDATLPKKSYL